MRNGILNSLILTDPIELAKRKVAIHIAKVCPATMSIVPRVESYGL